VKLDRIWIVRDRTGLTESVEELVFAAIIRGRDDDAVNLPHVILGCAPGTWDIEHWEAFSTIDEAQEEAQRRWEAFGR
jgi:hypothetical protein